MHYTKIIPDSSQLCSPVRTVRRYFVAQHSPNGCLHCPRIAALCAQYPLRPIQITNSQIYPLKIKVEKLYPIHPENLTTHPGLAVRPILERYILFLKHLGRADFPMTKSGSFSHPDMLAPTSRVTRFLLFFPDSHRSP